MKRFGRMAAIFGCMLWTVCGSPPVSGAAQKTDRLRGVIARSDRFPVNVDYRQTLDQMIKAGKYGKVDSNITPSKFLINEKGMVETELALVQISGDRNHLIGSDDAIRDIKALGFEPAKIEHCLAFGAQHPGVERTIPIVFLGSEVTLPNGNSVVPRLEIRDAKRELHLSSGRSFCTRPYTYWYFAAVRQIARSETFPVKVDYTQTLDEMIKAGKYTAKDRTITAENLPHEISGKGTVNVEVVLLQFSRDISSAEVKKEITSRGLEPVKIEHLLAFGAQHPEVQRKFEIAFLGACWIEMGRFRVVPCLSSNMGLGADPARHIALLAEPLDGVWPKDFRFAAVRTKKK